MQTDTPMPDSAVFEGLPRRPRAAYVGLDLSLADTGVAVIDEDGGITTARIRSKAAPTPDLKARAGRLVDHVSAILAAVPDGIECVTVEGMSFASRSAHAHDMGGLWWLVVTGLIDVWHTVHVVPPSNVKKYATGNGGASKDEVLAQVIRRYPATTLSNNNEADALVLAAIGARHHGHPVDDMPKLHLDALVKVGWAA